MTGPANPCPPLTGDPFGVEPKGGEDPVMAELRMIFQASLVLCGPDPNIEFISRTLAETDVEPESPPFSFREFERSAPFCQVSWDDDGNLLIDGRITPKSTFMPDFPDPTAPGQAARNERARKGGEADG